MPEVHKTREFDKDPDELWALIGDFHGIHKWVQGVEPSESLDDGARRKMTIGPGGFMIERLVEEGERSYTYAIDEGPLPVTNYQSTLSVKDAGGGKSIVDWHGKFDAAEGATDESAVQIVEMVYEGGLARTREDALLVTDADLAFTPAVELAELIRLKKISPVEVVEVYARRIEELNPKLGAYLTTTLDEALDEAKDAEAKINGDELPPFFGVPISIKDLNDTAGVRTTHGNGAFKDRDPRRTDEEVVARIKRAGFIMLGKTNTPEFGRRASPIRPAYFPARNPWDTDTHDRWFVRWCGRRSRGGAVSGLARLRRWRIDPHPGGAMRAVTASSRRADA